MIKGIGLVNASDEFLIMLTLMAPETSGIIIRGITGLGPAKANVVTRENVGISGSKVTSTRTPFRNILLDLGFMALPSIEAVRLKTYEYFQPEASIRLAVVTTGGTVAPNEVEKTYFIDGYVESNEPNIFSDQEGCTISIICPDPFFQTEDESSSGDIRPVAAAFEFPFGYADASGTFIFGELTFESASFSIENVGSVTVEPTLTIAAIGGTVVDPSIYFFSPNDPAVVQSLDLVFSTAFPDLDDGEYIVIVTEKQLKSITKYTPDGNDLIATNYLGALSLNSSWPVLKPGDNLFVYDAVTGGGYIRLSYEYKVKFIGV